MSLTALINIAGDGLAAQTAALDATSQNVANVNTPGYSRVTANLETTSTGDTYSGSVVASGVISSFDQFTFGNVLSEQGLGGAADSRSQALSNVENVIAPSGGTIADSVNTFFGSLTALATSPSDPSTRATVLQDATSLAQNISGTAAGLSTERASLLAQAQGVATQVNGQLSQMAALNGQIAAESAGGNQPTDLENQRDALASSLSTEIGAQVINGPSGYTLLSSNTALVSGSSASSVSVGLGSTGDLQIMATSTGGAAQDITSGVTQGTLGGIVEARDQDIPSLSSQLDQFAYNLSTSVNAVYSTGYGLDGVTGRNLFAAPSAVAGAAYSMAVDPSVVGQPDQLAASGSAADVPGGNSVAVALAALASQSLAGGQPPAQAFGAIAANIGNALSSAQSESQLRASTVTQAQNLNQSQSGVSLDQEMTNMTQFQNAYQASSKVLQTAESLLEELMADVGPAS